MQDSSTISAILHVAYNISLRFTVLRIYLIGVKIIYSLCKFLFINTKRPAHKATGLIFQICCYFIYILTMNINTDNKYPCCQ